MATTITKTNSVRGTVKDARQTPLPNLKVEIYDVDMRSWQPLGNTVTNSEGWYELEWKYSEISGRGRKTADIAVKVFTIEKGTELFKSGMDQVRYNASGTEEINIIIKQQLPVEKVEFDWLVKEVTSLTNKIPIEELEESKKNQDITFLSNESEVSAVKLEHLVVAHRLYKLSKADADFFYALLRKNTLLGKGVAGTLQNRTIINIGDDDNLILYDAALVDETKIGEDIKSAVNDMLIVPGALKNLKQNIEILKKYRKKAETYYEQEHPKKAVSLLTNLLNPGKIAEIQQLFQDNKNDLTGFLEKVSDPGFLDAKTPANDKLNEAIYRMYDLGKAAIPKLLKENKIKKAEDIQKLARFNKANWVETIEKTNPGLKDRAVVNTYASTIVRKFEKAFPTTAFAAQLERSSEKVLKNHDEVVDFLNKHEDFDLAKSNPDLFFKEKKVAAKDVQLIGEELKSVQRIFKLIPHYGKSMALREAKIHSAFNIVSVGESRFINDIAIKAGLSDAEAKEVYKKAEAKNTAAMFMIGEMNDMTSALDIASLDNDTLAKKIEAVSTDFPNLKSLFKLTDICECEHCRSVYSPAAYLVEILQFLDKRAVVAGNAKAVLFTRRPDIGEIDLGCENANTPLKYIDLICEILEEAVAPDTGIMYNGPLTDGADPSKGKISANLLNALVAAGLPVTNKGLIHETEPGPLAASDLPHYLRDTKLVCKIVNDVAPNNYKIYRLRQTMSPAEELDAAPEYVNAQAYNILSTNNTAFKLPFDLPQTEARAYFERFGIGRDELMKSFQLAGGPTDEAIAAETLGLSNNERQLIANSPAPNNNAAQQAFWNVPAPGNVVDYLKQVDHFLDRTGLTYKQLELLLKLRFINKNNNLFIFNNDLTCDTATKEIMNLDLDVADRIHRFLRLQKKTGWKYETLDEAISQANLGNGTLNDNCIKIIANLKRLIDKTGMKPEELICCYGEIPHILLPYKTTTPYDSIFQNKSGNAATEPELSSDNVTINESAAIKKQIGAFKATICTCTSIKESDFDKLVAVVPPVLPNSDLSFANLSRLYAIGRFLKKLKLKMEEFLLLKELTGIDPLSSPAAAFEFYKAVSDTGTVKLSDIKFMLWHVADNLPDREIKLDKLDALIKSLQAAYQKSFNDNRSLYKDDQDAEPQKEALKSKLSGLNVLSDADVNILLNFVDCNWKYSWIDEEFVEHTNLTPANPVVLDAITFITDKKIDTLIDVSQVTIALNALQVPRNNFVAAETALIAAQTSGTNIPAAELAFDAAKTPYNNAQKALIKAWLDAISTYGFDTQKFSLLTTAIATAFKTSPDIVEVVLKNAILKNMAPGNEKLIDVLMNDSLIDVADITGAHPLPILPAVSEGVFAKQYAAVRLLHKLFSLISWFKSDTTQIKWFLQNNFILGWFEFDKIPFAPGQPAIAYTSFVEFSKLLAIVKSYSPVINPLDAEKPISFLSIMDLLLIPATPQDQLMQAFALLTGYEKADLIDIDSYFFGAFSVGNYNNIKNLKRLLDCTGDIRKLSANKTQVTNYVNPVLTAAIVADLRNNLKTRYDEDTWLSTLKEIMDKIRPQKRDALVTYILATNPGVKDENDLYEYFLADVEMGSCMPSSRIVLAHNSIQLFVQRCLMGLEPNAIADTDKDTGWKHWQWMKNYRVWEANRKIFLYPENWYDVTLADDKSFLLNEFINELQQNELTNDTAEEAFRKYLEKLDNIAFLEVKATWYDVPTRTMHVFARTKGGDPAIYYYRRFEKERSWTAWEKVDLDIQGDQLLAFIRNNRLYLAWLVFSEEANTNQRPKVPATSDQGKDVPPDLPMKKLIIQLAISEFSNKKWQPKKVSKDSISTPEDYITGPLDRSKYNIMYVKASDQIWIFSVYINKLGLEYPEKAGAFNVAGCKGYPEKLPPDVYLKFFPDFLPDFKQTWLMTQRYNELTFLDPDDLAVKNGIKFLDFYELLKATPGQFRISYPFQLTVLDVLSLIYQLLSSSLTTVKNSEYKGTRTLKLPLGTLLPYFMEDSWHAYVIIPGFYKQEFSRGEFPDVIGLNDDEKRTASNVFQLIDDIINWIKKMMQEFTTNPPAYPSEIIQRIIADADFQAIITEMSRYKGLQPLLQLMIGNTNNDEFEEHLKLALEKEGLVYGEQFKNMYHPLVCALRTILYKNGANGIRELMKRETQLMVNTSFNFKNYYKPNELHIAKLAYKQADGTLAYDYPIEDVDFTSDGSYSLYNWDMFFRVPLHIAESLTRNQRFEEALTWFHYMFNPTGALPGTGVQKYWVTKPFYLNQEADYIAQRIDSLMYATADKTNPDIKELEFAIEQWRDKPFRPDVVARFRPVAYQKALLMKYVDNLAEWGDYLFRQDTMESVAQATQMYILADKLLGPKPKIIPPVVKSPYETYNQIEAKLDSFGNALIALENILPDITVLPEGGAELPPPPITLSMLYFCIPHNEKMFAYWDRVADRLFKIRHCQNIDGIERSLALFAPPIDPGMLVRAAASGLDISAILSGLNAPIPFYRFNTLSQKATELAQEVRTLGNSLLQALEKKDADALSLLKSELELKVLNAVKDIKKLQISEAKEQIEVLKRTQKVTEEKHNYYKAIQKIIPKEQLNLDKLAESKNWQLAANITYTLGAGLALIPDLALGASGFGGSPHGAAKFGGSLLAHSTDAVGKGFGIFGALASYEATCAATIGGHDRRFDDWKLQERLAFKELASIDKQIKAAEIRKEISETDLKNHELQIENAKKTDEVMRSKFTNKELYDWIIGQISSVYFKSYQLAHDFAKKAERCYRFELGNDDGFIEYGYWESMKKGLQSADKLIHDIKRMETSYLDKNKREYEITKHVSLAQLDPLALIKLRNTGVCDFEIPEALYDLDYAGQYFRRLKSVSISLPCVAGPYTSVSAKLSLVNNKYRKNTNPENTAGTAYIEDPGNDERFVYNIGAIQSVATGAQNDAGLFELNFRDDRYLPFECCGAISSWRLELPTPAVAMQFNYETISDVILHIKYTAREGGGPFKILAEEAALQLLLQMRQQIKSASESGIHLAINMKQEMSNEWYLFKKNKTTAINITSERLPYFIQAMGGATIDHITFFAKAPGAVTVKINNTPLPINGALWGLQKANTGIGVVTLDNQFDLSIDAQAELDSIEELMIVAKINLP